MALAAVPADLHITCQQQFRKCSKTCKTCAQGSGHGPYWYVYWREGARVRSTYIGKLLPASIEARIRRQKAESVPEPALVGQQEEMAASCSIR